MNAGALAASGARVLLFLHADTTLPPDADRLILRALAEGRHVWGRFDVRIAGRPRMLRVVAACMNARSRWSGIATGDQALFMTRAAFDAVGRLSRPAADGRHRDVEASANLVAPGLPARARDHLGAALGEPRRLATIVLMWRLRWAYWRGASPQLLARRYE